MKKIFAFLSLFCPLMAFSQETFVTENEKCCIWQPGAKLTFEMFENTNPDSADIKDMQRENRQMILYTGICHVVDVPKVKKKERKKLWLPDKGYFAAVFSKYQSCIFGRDSFDLKCAQLAWDARELGTRVSRIWLNDLEKKIGGPSDNLYTVYLMTAANEGKEYSKYLLSEILHNVLIPRDKDKYLEYRRKIDEELERTSKFATSKEEATRLILGRPIDPNMEKAESIVGVLGGNKSDEE